MSTSSASSVSVHECRWDWCRETFVTGDRLAKHVLDDHVAKEASIKREEIRLELRAFDGTSIGAESTIPTSLLMNENAFLGDDEKEHDAPSNVLSAQSQIHQKTAGEAEVRHPDSNNTPSGVSQIQSPDPPLAEQAASSPSPAQQLPLLSRPFRTPRSSPSPNGFQALAAASSCSPDPRSMVIGPSPSIAEIIAHTINDAHRTNRETVAGPSPAALGSPVRRSILPSSPLAGQNGRSSSIQGKRKPEEVQLDDSPRRRPNGNGSHAPSSPPRSTSRARSRTSSNASNKPFARPARDAAALSPIFEYAGPSNSQNGSHVETQNSPISTPSGRPFRTGSIRLEPNLAPQTSDNDSLSCSNSAPIPQPQTQAQVESLVKPQSHSQTGPGTNMPPPVPEEPNTSYPPTATSNGTNTNTYMDDIDMLSSILDHPPIDVQNQSQWPLATQAPYSFDSQLASFTSQ